MRLSQTNVLNSLDRADPDIYGPVWSYVERLLPIMVTFQTTRRRPHAVPSGKVQIIYVGK